jgi:hypothetical protein
MTLKITDNRSGKPEDKHFFPGLKLTRRSNPELRRHERLQSAKLTKLALLKGVIELEVRILDFPKNG